MKYKQGPGGKASETDVWKAVYNKRAVWSDPGNLGEHCRRICITPVHVHVVHFSESVQHALKANWEGRGGGVSEGRQGWC